MKRIPVYFGLIGLGHVGEGVVKILQENRALIEERLGRPLILKKAADINSQRGAGLNLKKGVFTRHAEEILADPEIKIVVEAIGGVEPARKYILKALSAGKNVVTSNKEVLAKFGSELYRTAAAHKVYLLSEGAVAGGIPILRPLRTSLSADDILEIFGIINGTTNFILSRMEKTGAEFSVVLKKAQVLGIAEANPQDDLSGRDAAYKAAILASHAFKTKINFGEIAFEGITKIEKQDLDYARELGYSVKLLAVLRKIGPDKISAAVYPVFVPLSHQLAKISDHFNAIYVKTNSLGEVMFYGPGAGSLPTGSAVLSDVLEIANLIGKPFDPTVLPVLGRVKKIVPVSELNNQFYIRLWAKDQIGVLEAIAGVFARNRVSIAAVVQKAVIKNNAEIVIITHAVLGKNVLKAVKEIEKLTITVGVKNLLRVGV